MENAAVCPEPGGAATAAAETNDAKATREKRQAAALGGRVEDRIWALLDQRFGFEKLEQSNFETAAAALQSKDGAKWEAAVAGYKGGQAWLEPPSPPLPTPTTSAGNSNQSDLAALRGDVDRLLLCCLSTVQFDHIVD